YLGFLSGANGSYVLSGTGSLTVNGSSATGSEFVGYSGSGSFNQSGGTHTVGTTASGPTLELGYNAGANGSYVLSGTGSLTVNGFENIGYVASGGAPATGSFNQSGGTHTVVGVLTLAAVVGSHGNYTLSAGTLTAGSTTINTNGSFQFNGSSASL